MYQVYGIQLHNSKQFRASSQRKWLFTITCVDYVDIHVYTVDM